MKFSQKISFTGKTVLITGGSSGIGEALAVEFVRLGSNVIICGRNLIELNRVKNSLGALSDKVRILQIDLSDADKAYELIKEYLATNKVDVFINNAGRGQRGEFVDDLDSLDAERALMELNYFSVVALTKAAYESMDQNGHLVVMGSMAGVLGSPYRTAYSASKFAVTLFYECLHVEGSKVPLTTIYAGYVNTNLGQNAVVNTKNSEQNTKNHKKGMEPKEFAQIAAKAIYNKEKHVFICQFSQKIVLFLKFWVPELSHWILYQYGKKVRKET